MHFYLSDRHLKRAQSVCAVLVCVCVCVMCLCAVFMCMCLCACVCGMVVCDTPLLVSPWHSFVCALVSVSLSGVFHR